VRIGPVMSGFRSTATSRRSRGARDPDGKAADRSSADRTRATQGETEANTFVADAGRVRDPGWWIVAVTVVDGPDDDHPLIIRLSLSSRDGRQQRTFASIDDACEQLGSWLSEVATEVRR
jgi:hypothetical protein